MHNPAKPQPQWRVILHLHSVMPSAITGGYQEYPAPLRGDVVVIGMGRRADSFTVDVERSMPTARSCTTAASRLPRLSGSGAALALPCCSLDARGRLGVTSLVATVIISARRIVVRAKTE